MDCLGDETAKGEATGLGALQLLCSLVQEAKDEKQASGRSTAAGKI
jgi:hypothetical protein